MDTQINNDSNLNQSGIIVDDFIDKLNNSPKWMSRILQVSIDAFWIMDSKGVILEVNNATLEILGYSKEELLGLNIKDLEADNQERDYIDKVINEDRHSFEAKYNCKDGSVVDLEISVNFINDLVPPFLVVFARDITERKRKKEELQRAYQENQRFLDKLRKQKNRINTILHTSMDAFWVMDNQGEIVEVNEAFMDLFGYSLVEIMSMNISSLDITKKADEMEAYLAEIRVRKKDRFESKYRCKDGRVIELEISVTFVDSLDEPMFVVFARDITERKIKHRELEKAYQDNQIFLDKLRKEGNRTNTILHTSMDAFWVMDSQGDILEVNQTFIDLFGYSLIEIMSMNINQLDISKNKIRGYLIDIKNKEKSSFESKYRCKDGSIVELEISANFVDSLDEPIYVVFARDITERKIRQRELEKAYQENKDFLDELREQGNRTNTILQTSIDAFWVMDGQGDILEVNEAFIDLFEYSLIEVMKMNISDLDFSRSKEEIQDHLIEIKDKKKDRFESKYRSKDGNVVELEISATFVSSLDQPIYVVFARDITERKRRQKELDEVQKRLMQSEKMAALGRLVAGVAHEINTPLGIGVTVASYLAEMTQEIIRLYNSKQMTKNNLEEYLGSTLESTEMVLKNLENASELISKFKQVAVDQTNNKKREIELKEYLIDILISLKPRLKKSNHTIKMKCSDAIKVYTYPGAISQIITNLTINSLRHAFEDGECGEISIEVREDKKLIELKYRDDGKGIPKEHIKKIFEPFFTTKRGQGGTGLGLNLVYNLVTSALGGKIRCESSSQIGTIFTIEIPKGVMGDG